MRKASKFQIVLIALIAIALFASAAWGIDLKTRTIGVHFVFVEPVGGAGLAAYVVGKQVKRIEEETGISLDVKSIRVIETPEECNGILWSNLDYKARVAQLSCLRKYAVRDVTNRLDEWVHFYTPPFLASDGTRRFAGLATGVPELGTCPQIFQAIKCHPVTVTNLAIENSEGEYRLEHILEATEHEFGHIIGLEHRQEFSCSGVAYTMHPAALAYCSPNSYQCLVNDRQSCSLHHHLDDIGRMFAQFKFIKRDRVTQRKKCRAAFSTGKCIRSCKKRIRFYRPQLENLPSLRKCKRRPTRGKKSLSTATDIIETFIYR